MNANILTELYNKKGISHFTVIKILKKLSKKELLEFEKFLKSPYYNQRITIVNLFCELKKYYPEFTDKCLTKQNLFSSISKKKYDDKLFRKYFSLLNKLAEEFLNVIETKNESSKKDLNILKQLSSRSLNDVFSKKLNEVEKVFSKNYEIDVDNFLLMHQFSTIKFNQKHSTNEVFHDYKDFYESFRHLLNYFMLNLSVSINQMNSNKFSFKEAGKENSITKIFEKMDIDELVTEILEISGDKDKNLFLEIVSNDIKMSSAENGFEHYTKLKDLIFNNYGKLSKRMLFHYIQRLNIFCIIEAARGYRNLNKDLFENYKIILREGFFYLDEKRNLTFIDFRAVLLCALKNKEFVWAEKFINDNIKNIKEEIRENILNYGNALLSFYKNQYDSSIEFISKIKSESNLVSIDIYVLKLKIFYTLGYFDSAKSVVDSFRHFIKNHKHISGFHKETLLNFLKYFNEIMRMRINKNEAKLKMLKFEIVNSRNTKEKVWMTGKIEELLDEMQKE